MKPLSQRSSLSSFPVLTGTRGDADGCSAATARTAERVARVERRLGSLD